MDGHGKFENYYSQYNGAFKEGKAHGEGTYVIYLDNLYKDLPIDHEFEEEIVEFNENTNRYENWLMYGGLWN